MSADYIIPSSKGKLVAVAAMNVIWVGILIRKSAVFLTGPDWRSAGEALVWMILLACGIVSTVRHARTASVIRIAEKDLYLRRVAGKLDFPEERVIAVTSDQIQFHLFTKKDEISVSKKKVPLELEEELTARQDRQGV